MGWRSRPKPDANVKRRATHRATACCWRFPAAQEVHPTDDRHQWRESSQDQEPWPTCAQSVQLAALMKRNSVATSVLALIVGGAFVAFVFLWARRGAADISPRIGVSHLQVQPLTFGGDAQSPSIAADGWFVTFIRGGAVSLR